MHASSIPARSELRRKAPEYLANATFVLAGYGLGDIFANLVRAVL